MAVIELMEGATVSQMVAKLNEEGCRAARGGPVTYNTVKRALTRIGREAPVIARPAKQSMASLKTIRARHEKTETFRTPAYSFTPLLDYCPDWFQGRGFDPSAGDGRMIREIIRRGNPGPHFVNDIRVEELPPLLDCGQATIGDYLTMTDLPQCDFLITNPPFTKAIEIVEKARTHVSGPTCILQSIQWQSTRKRSEWLRKSGLSFVLNLPRRPKWEVEVGNGYSNIFDFAWFVFLPGYEGSTTMDWLVETQ
jgi:hypothetical protein